MVRRSPFLWLFGTTLRLRPAAFSTHYLRARSIASYLENAGTLDIAQRIASHADSGTTKALSSRRCCSKIGIEFATEAFRIAKTRYKSMLIRTDVLQQSLSQQRKSSTVAGGDIVFLTKRRYREVLLCLNENQPITPQRKRTR